MRKEAVLPLHAELHAEFCLRLLLPAFIGEPVDVEVSDPLRMIAITAITWHDDREGVL